MSHPIPEELSWQAFLYACGEMPTEDAAAFEELMAVDQAAREALAQAVMVGQAVTATASATVANSVTLPVTDGNRQSTITRSAALVAGLLLAFGVGWMVSQSSNTPKPGGSVDTADGSATSSIEANRLISLWGSADLLDESETDLAWTDEESASIFGTELVHDDTTKEFSVPAWMLAAVENNLPPEMDDDMRDPSRIP